MEYRDLNYKVFEDENYDSKKLNDKENQLQHTVQ